MKDLIPGYVIRTTSGDLVGFKYPISHRNFYGDESERQQHEHTRKIMEAQGDLISLPDRKYIFQQGHGQ